MRKVLIAALLLAGACSKNKADACEQVWNKMAPAMGEIANQAGRPLPADAKAKFLSECRTGDRMKNDPVFDCVLKASDNDAVTKCMTSGVSAYKSKSMAIEAKLRLQMIAKNAQAAFQGDGAFPVGTVGPTPAGPCCNEPGQQCEVTGDVDPLWDSLGVFFDEPVRFSYRYESDGKTATATAVGDLDCDGTSITYKLEMSVDADGKVTTNLVEPAPDAD
jgi:hypothetical protein